MAFSSIHFIFLFLPVVLFFYFVFPKRNWRNSVLGLSSFIFFAWSDPNNLHVLLISVFLNYIAGIIIGKSRGLGNVDRSKLFVWVAVILNLLLLFFYKYLGFFGAILDNILQNPISIREYALPLGISYFTFSGLAYIIDIYREVEQPEKNLLRFSSFLIMFPKLVQGPITQFKDVKSGFRVEEISKGEIASGVRRFIKGLGIKVLLADQLLIASNQVFDANLNRLGADVAWFGLIAYTLVIYLDFSAYTDMALGIGQVLGFKLPENFNYPYISRSITDFWRRWHMSLTNWFRNYVFLPLEITRRKEKYLRQQTNIFIVFFLTGLWHGASWNFVIWGAYFGIILAVEASGFRHILNKLPRFFQHFYAIIIVMVGWVFFRLPNLSSWGVFFRALVGLNGWSSLETFRSLNIIFYIPIAIIAILFCLPWKSSVKILMTNPVLKSAILDFMLFGILLLTISYILANGFAPFMYTQF